MLLIIYVGLGGRVLEETDNHREDNCFGCPRKGGWGAWFSEQLLQWFGELLSFTNIDNLVTFELNALSFVRSD